MEIKKPGSSLFLHLRTIFTTTVLNFCVRYGNRCVHCAIATRLFLENFVL